MAGKKPLFVSAPRLVLGVRDGNGNFIKIAYAIGLSVNVSTTVQPVYVIGDFGPVSYEPTMYNPVTGSFQIVRLQSKNFKDKRVANAKALYSESKILNKDTITASVPDVDNNIITQANLFKHLNPAEVLMSSSFDIEIYFNINGYGHAITSSQVNNFNSTTTPPAANDPKLFKFMTLKDCRITSRNVNLAQGQFVNEPLNFMGLLAIQSGEALDSSILEKSV